MRVRLGTHKYRKKEIRQKREEFRQGQERAGSGFVVLTRATSPGGAGIRKTAHDVIQSHQLKAGSEVITKLAGKNKVEVSILGKAAKSKHDSKPDNLKDVMIQSMRDAAEIVAAVPDLWRGAIVSRRIRARLTRCSISAMDNRITTA